MRGLDVLVLTLQLGDQTRTFVTRSGASRNIHIVYESSVSLLSENVDG